MSSRSRADLLAERQRLLTSGIPSRKGFLAEELGELTSALALAGNAAFQDPREFAFALPAGCFPSIHWNHTQGWVVSLTTAVPGPQGYVGPAITCSGHAEVLGAAVLRAYTALDLRVSDALLQQEMAAQARRRRELLAPRPATSGDLSLEDLGL